MIETQAVPLVQDRMVVSQCSRTYGAPVVAPADRRKRIIVAILAGATPALLLAFGIARFVLNHFDVRPPYLLDAGLLSKIVYRDGLALPIPGIAVDYAHLFYEVHISPLSSLFSVLSYLVPIDRIHWYAFVEAVLYVPFGLVVYLVASRLDPGSALRRLPLTIAAALAFSFSGLVLWTVDYLHFEIATSGMICLMLGALVTDRPRTAWLCLALAASVKQDGGIHIAMAVLPLLLLHWRGTDMAPTRRRLVLAIAVGVAITVVELVAQRVFLHPFPRLTHAYLGDPLYGHLSLDLLADRAAVFFTSEQVIYYPFLATCLVAALRRDARYLLGWASVVPWFVFNFLAVEDTKAWFVAYGVAPFLVGVFWVYLYGAYLAPSHRRLHAGVLEAVFTLVCLASTLGICRGQPGGLKFTVREMAISHHRDVAAVDGFVDAILTHRAELGHLGVDYAVAALAIESLELSDRWYPGAKLDAIAFHRASKEHDAVVVDVAADGLDHCLRVIDTGLVLCARGTVAETVLAGLHTEVLPAPK